MKPYLIRQNELSIDKKHYYVKELHSNHEDMVKMKTLARLYFWWPVDRNIDNLIKCFDICMKQRPDTLKADHFSI